MNRQHPTSRHLMQSTHHKHLSSNLIFHDTFAWSIDRPGCDNIDLHCVCDGDEEGDDEGLIVASFSCPPGGVFEAPRYKGIEVVVGGELLIEQPENRRCVINRGEVKCVTHTPRASYRNNSQTEMLRFLNISCTTRTPSEDHRPEANFIGDGEARTPLTPIATQDGYLDSIQLDKELDMHWLSLLPGERIGLEFRRRDLWLLTVTGTLECGGRRFEQGSATMIETPHIVEMIGRGPITEVLLVEMCSSEPITSVKDEHASGDWPCDEAELQAVFEHVCQNADSYGVSDEAEASIMAEMLILERNGEIYRTGEKRLSSNGLWQDVFRTRTPSLN